MRISQPYGERYRVKEYSHEPRRRYFIACEGEETEYQYFKGIMSSREEIGINPLVEVIPVKHDASTTSNPAHIYQEARAAVESAENYFEGDKLCIIVDRDRESFSEAQYKVLMDAESRGEITFCVSNPCFELWLLMHFTDCLEYSEAQLLENTKMTRKRTYVETLLMEKLGGSYNKSRIYFENNYRKHVRRAVKNSLRFASSSLELKTKVGTGVGRLLDEMLQRT